MTDSVGNLEAACRAIPGGERLVPLMHKVGINTADQLVKAVEPEGDAHPGVAAHAKLAAAGTAAGVKWAPPSVKNVDSGAAMLCKMAAKAKALTASSATAVSSTLKSAFGALMAAEDVPADDAGAKASDSSKIRRAAAQLYDRAETVHDRAYEAEDRVKYEMVSKAHVGYCERQPLAVPLTDFSLQLALTSTQKTEYVAFGQTFVRSDAADAKLKSVETDIELFQQMGRRAEMRVVAGCFDAVETAVANGQTVPTGEKILAESTKTFVRVEDGREKVMRIACFATPSVQELQVRKVRAFRAEHPHVSIMSIVVGLDTPVEKAIANRLMRGFTADAAVKHVCEKEPQLWTLSAVEDKCRSVEASQPASGASATKGEAGGPAGGRSKRGGERTTDETLAAKERRIEQQERQIANLKQGKVGGRRQAGGGAFGGWAAQRQPFYQQPMQGMMQPQFGQQAMQRQVTQPTGPSCPPDVCRDFNFKVGGCPRNPCKFKHICCLCGSQQHGWKGNH